ncbi:hypothetical protein C7S16_4982 [Burkholderia thailandensis]|uniref:Uncharacterized protein n=1 Tax=Burkholderia thailandensis TaxID=57975 RepID=A0AAW9CQC8_BURTH|nr:hypothetical protein [Burkholderia thailandensis]
MNGARRPDVPRRMVGEVSGRDAVRHARRTIAETSGAETSSAARPIGHAAATRRMPASNCPSFFPA